MNGPIVVIGPAGCGKSSTGSLLARRLGVGFVDIDETGDGYYREVGWSIDRLVRRIEAVGRVAAEAEWGIARAHAVARVIQDHPGAVIALGAGHTSYTTAEDTQAVAAALQKAASVVLLLPSPDRDLSLSVLRRRCLKDKGTDWIRQGHDFLAQWLEDAYAAQLATATVFTGDDSPEHTVQLLVDIGIGVDGGEGEL